MTAQLRCYLPEPVDPVWGRLRHLRARREQLWETHTRCVQQVRDLLECVWPAVLDAAGQRFKSMTWVAALAVVVAGTTEPGPHPSARAGPVHPAGASRGDPSREGQAVPADRPKVFAAVTDAAGVVEHRQAALEWISWTLTDWERARADQSVVGARMVAVLRQLGLTDLVCSIVGLSRSWPRPATCAGSPPPAP